MRASVYYRYGTPDVLEVAELPNPEPRDNEVLIRVRAASATAADCALIRGRPFIARLATGVRRPQQHVLGSEFAGTVEDIGKHVSRFRVGDEIVGASGVGFGGHAEYICIADDGALIKKPVSLSFEEAVAVCEGGLTALPFLVNVGKIKPLAKVLINGASGSVGSSAVQIAKHFGADVTAVCSRANEEMVRDLGADSVIDYTVNDFTRSGFSYDIIFDAVGKSSFTRCKSSLRRGGCYLSTVVGPRILWQTLATSKFGDKRAAISFTGLRKATEKTDDLAYISHLVATGDLRPVLDRSYPLDEVRDAYRYISSGRKKGSVVLRV